MEGWLQRGLDSLPMPDDQSDRGLLIEINETGLLPYDSEYGMCCYL